jgi:hypothetical protein
VQAVVDEAKDAFRREANIRIIPSVNNDEIVEEFADQNPTWVMTPECGSGGYGDIFTRVGKWFRKQSNPYSGRGGATVFIVEDVIGKAGCFIGPLVDYGYIDEDGLFNSPGVPATEGRKLLLAHELGHACDLFHRDNPRNLMAKKHQSPTGVQRTSHLTNWQQSVIRSCPRVRYR